MKTVIEMAREAGLRSAVLLHMYGKEDALCDSEIEELRQLERFAELVRADERGRMCEQCKGRSNEKSTSNEANRPAVLGESKQAN